MPNTWKSHFFLDFFPLLPLELDLLDEPDLLDELDLLVLLDDLPLDLLPLSALLPFFSAAAA